MVPGKSPSKGGRNGKSVRVKTAKGRKNSSIKWLQRQLNDPYVRQANKDGYRSRAVYKLKEIDDKYKIFKSNMKVVDLGAAPGSWTEVALEKKATVIGIDLLDIEPIDGVTFIKGDFLDDDIYDELLEISGGDIDVVMSDMAANSCGHSQTDHIRIMALCEAALEFAIKTLKKDGSFIAKVLQGGTEKELLDILKKNFTSVKHFKPESSRSGSAEMYVIAKGFGL